MTSETRFRNSAFWTGASPATALLAAALALTVAATPSAGSTDDTPAPRALVLVVNKKLDLKDLNVRELKRIFLRQRTEVGEVSLRPVAHSAVSPEGELFNLRILGMGADDYKSHWMNQQIEGAAKTPTTLKSDRAILIYVRKNPGGIGYVYDTSVRDIAEDDEDLHILTIQGTAWTAPEYVLTIPRDDEPGTK